MSTQGGNREDKSIIIANFHPNCFYAFGYEINDHQRHPFSNLMVVITIVACRL